MLSLRRLRLRTLLLFLLLLACMSIIQVGTIAPMYEAAGIASMACVMFWGALWNLTAGILLPALATSLMERRERRQFLEEEALGAPAKAKLL